MLKMIIRMDDNKINNENKYRLDGIYRTIDNIFFKMGFHAWRMLPVLWCTVTMGMQQIMASLEKLSTR